MPRLQMLHSVGYVRPLKPIVRANSSSSGSHTSMFAFAPEQQQQPYKDIPDGKILEILRIRNRFDKAMKKGAPHWSGGFRDLAFKVKVGFKVSPVDDVSSSASQIVSAIQYPECRSPREEHRNLCPCTNS